MKFKLTKDDLRALAMECIEQYGSCISNQIQEYVERKSQIEIKLNSLRYLLFELYRANLIDRVKYGISFRYMPLLDIEISRPEVASV